jgi:radical SAM protein with 4Fe4S-binding SPASM domain
MFESGYSHFLGEKTGDDIKTEEELMSAVKAYKPPSDPDNTDAPGFLIMADLTTFLRAHSTNGRVSMSLPLLHRLLAFTTLFLTSLRKKGEKFIENHSRQLTMCYQVLISLYSVFYEVSSPGLEQLMVDLITFRSQASRCIVCDSPSRSTCSKCRFARYCGADCQKKDWARHKGMCGKLSIDETRARFWKEDLFPRFTLVEQGTLLNLAIRNPPDYIVKPEYEEHFK